MCLLGIVERPRVSWGVLGWPGVIRPTQYKLSYKLFINCTKSAGGGECIFLNVILLHYYSAKRCSKIGRKYTTTTTIWPTLCRHFKYLISYQKFFTIAHF